MTSSPNKDSFKRLWVAILGLSAVILSFLFWWIYQKEEAQSSAFYWVRYLPYLNCFLNATTSVLLVIGVDQIKKGRREIHREVMISAAVTSGIFLVSYLTYHHFQGDTKFLGMGMIRYLYFFILVTHILLSIIQIPLIMATFSFAYLKKWKLHKRWAKITFPIWLYVSTTGVLVFLFLKLVN